MRADSFVVKEHAEHRTTAPHILPIYATSSFAFKNLEECISVFQNPTNRHTYSRYGNPTTDTTAQKIAALEAFGLDIEAEGVMTSSGMSAISALLLGLLRSGDQVLTQGNLYGGTTELLTDILQPLGIEVIFTPLQQLETVEEALRTHPRIRMVYAETPANPTLACIDLEAIAQLAHRYGTWLAVDNTFATPILQQPFAFGADFVVHSTTKFLNGHGNSIAGVVVGRDPALMRQRIWRTVKLIGANCSPFEAWLAYNGLKTLALRMERHSANALALAQFLEKHPAVARVNYPGLASHPDAAIAQKQMRGGFGAMLSFELRQGFRAALDCVNRLRFCTLAPTLGDVDTLILHPASSSHLNVPRPLREQNGISDGLIRVSVGIENPADILADFEQALPQ